EVNLNLVQIRRRLEILVQASDKCGSAYHWSSGVLFQELQWTASTELLHRRLRFGEGLLSLSSFIRRQLSVVWSNQLTAMSLMLQLGRCQPWTATQSPGPGGSLYRDMGKCVRAVVEKM
ncbi:hypothetical protein HispidOSU_029546, partial [Sigmodon hispidus]